MSGAAPASRAAPPSASDRVRHRPPAGRLLPLSSRRMRPCSRLPLFGVAYAHSLAFGKGFFAKHFGWACLILGQVTARGRLARSAAEPNRTGRQTAGAIRVPEISNVLADSGAV
ncbi:hypothetical protein BOSE62_30211 [Bosea sp. 62]|nr:hypothetical protein BOSE46_140019 [Bosea sp. 46]CAD5268102.1 hypothetical protein BOSE21B_111415 [Bosea sp. 21B]CAD5270569.1 hypothetical protein BOSE7B_20224 [Bosea sp. 7B]VVT62361.1 hypothetical protein BOS5A_80021 [Bosea sp. EC-HK365B]VXB89460.1 hypothetical protein BOSE29B_150014 [Bosea sp. 29B]VXC13893.1 hypothetical protein BOSE62_30211 [Bosea sp. 62]VXC28011.1 hypothetical protein BOSE125_190021 [Bosea sp. 125]VXC66362.1 hypothetical protein BOSE127_30240 [Bosea sp. 127]